MAEEISLSLEETNKLRVSIGLAPIPVENVSKDGNGKLATSKKEATKDVTSLVLKETSNAENKGSQSQSEQETGQSSESFSLKRRIEEANERASKRRQAPKPLLYEEDTPIDDWLASLGNTNSKNSAKKARVPKKPTEEAGFKIGHSLKELDTIEGAEIFTLRDTTLLDDENDELLNERLAQRSKISKDLSEAAEVEQIKYNGRHYRPQDKEPEEETNDFADDAILTGNTIKLPTTVESAKSESVNVVQMASLFDVDEYNSSTDYTKKKHIKMKKVKKKSLSRRIVQDDEADGLVQAVSLEPTNAEEIVDEDEELQKLIASKRRLKQQKRKNLTPEQIAAEIKLNKNWEASSEIEGKMNQHVTFDDTAGFLESLEANILRPPADNDVKAEVKKSETIMKEDSSPKNTMQKIKEEEKLAPSPLPVEDDSGSPSFNLGISSTLRFLQSRKIIGTVSEEQKEQLRVQRQAKRDAELLSLQISIEERLVREDLATDKQFMTLPRDEREQVISEHLDHRLREKGLFNDNMVANGGRNRRHKRVPDKLVDFKPEVKLVYRDDSGRELNTKEAFKHLSHQFHGLGPGRAKVEKRLRKEKEEQKNSQDIHDVL